MSKKECFVNVVVVQVSKTTSLLRNDLCTLNGYYGQV